MATAEVTVLTGGAEVTVPAGNGGAGGKGGEELWLRPADLQRTLGWEIRPEGVCAGEVCVPLDPRLEGKVVRRQDGEEWFDVAAFARHVGQPYARSGEVWSFGAPAHEWQRWGGSGGEMAPDFALPDVNGSMRTLAEFRGKKVFLLTWASW